MRLSVFGCLLFALTAAGCGEEQGAGSFGESIGGNVTEFAQGVGSGVDAKLEIKVEVSEELAEAGMSATVAKQDTSLESPEKLISVYLISTQSMDTTLQAKAFNADGQEIGRARADVTFSDDDARYISFSFPREMDRLLVERYLIDRVKTSKPAAQEADVE